ncbi:hypothetical protein BH20CHL4_BH20CHL4_03650 [soil metagenome]
MKSSRRMFLGAAAAAASTPLLHAQALAQSDGTEGPSSSVEMLLPNYRILSYYGFPGNELMGILGEHELETLLAILQDQLVEYEAADSSRPWKLAFEVIASVAQAGPGEDGLYIAYTSNEVIQDYVDFTAANDLLLILDVQFGRKTISEEIEAVREWLSYPHVHLAIDPEFSVREGEVPGTDLGQIDAADVRVAQDTLAEISRSEDIPPKLLVVHQFNLYSITNRGQIEQIPDVQYVLEIDGWGPPEDKRATYEVVGGDVPHEFYGFKLWYRQDEPLMSAVEVMSLAPSPDIVIYQ